MIRLLVAIVMLVSAPMAFATDSRTFTASNQNLRNTSAAAMPLTGTIAFWHNPNWSSGDSAYHVMFMTSDGGATKFFPYMGHFTDNKIYIGFSDGTRSFWCHPTGSDAGFSDAGVFVAGTWKHHLITYNCSSTFCSGGTGTYNVSYYINGTAKCTQVFVGAFGTFSGIPSTGITVGNLGTGYTQVNTDSAIAEFSIWDRVLSASEITKAATSPSDCGSLATGLLNYWTLQGASPETSSGSLAESLTVTNAGTTASYPTIACATTTQRGTMTPLGTRTGARQSRSE